MIFEEARALHADLSQGLNYKILFSPPGVLMLAQNRARAPHLEADLAWQPPHGGNETEMVTPISRLKMRRKWGRIVDMT